MHINHSDDGDSSIREIIKISIQLVKKCSDHHNGWKLFHTCGLLSLVREEKNEKNEV